MVEIFIDAIDDLWFSKMSYLSELVFLKDMLNYEMYYENTKIIDQLHFNFCKRVLKVRSPTPNFIVYGELCRYPLGIIIKIRMWFFWVRLG